MRIKLWLHCVVLMMVGVVMGEDVVVDVSAVKNRMFDPFLGVTIDSGAFLSHWSDLLNLTSPVMRQLASNLGHRGNLLRVGGSTTDHLCFEVEHGGSCSPKEDLVYVSDMADLVSFVKAMEWRLIFGVSAEHGRFENQSAPWDGTNMAGLLEYFGSVSAPLHGIQFGNEPFQYPLIKLPPQSPEQYAQGAQSARQIPELCTVQDDPDGVSKWTKLAQVFGNISKSSGSYTPTFHHYYRPSSGVVPSDFLDPELLDSFGEVAETFVNTVAQFPSTIEQQGYLTETSSSYGGGANGASNRFAGVFPFLDKLGIAALNNIQAVIHQTLVDGNYALLSSPPSFTPNPAYYAAVLFNNLTSSATLSVQNQSLPGRTLRFYAFCGQSSETITVISLNVNQTNKSSLEFPSLNGCSYRDDYLITATSLNASTIFINGHLFSANPAGVLPPFPISRQPASSSFTLPPASAAFHSFHCPQISVCN